MRIDFHIRVDDACPRVQLNITTLNDQVRTVDDDISHRLCRGHTSARLDGFANIGAVVTDGLILDVLIPVVCDYIGYAVMTINTDGHAVSC